MDRTVSQIRELMANPRLRAARLDAGFTQAALGFAIGRDEGFICKLETGRIRRVDPAIKQKIADLLGRPSWLLFDS